MWPFSDFHIAATATVNLFGVRNIVVAQQIVYLFSDEYVWRWKCFIKLAGERRRGREREREVTSHALEILYQYYMNSYLGMVVPIWCIWILYSTLSFVTLKSCVVLYNESSTDIVQLYIALSQYIMMSKRITVSTGKNRSSKKKFSKTVPAKN